MIFTHPRCLQCFLTQENLTTKTLNFKVTSFVLLQRFFSQKPKNEAFYSVLQMSKSATEQSNSATKFLPSYCTNSTLSSHSAAGNKDSGTEKSRKEEAGYAHRIGHRILHIGDRFFTPSNFNFKSNFNSFINSMM